MRVNRKYPEKILRGKMPLTLILSPTRGEEIKEEFFRCIF